MFLYSRGSEGLINYKILFFIVLAVLVGGFFLLSSRRKKKFIKELKDMREHYKSMGLDFIDPFGATVYSGFIKNEFKFEAYLLLFRDRMIFEVLKEKYEVLFKNIKECRIQTGRELIERGILHNQDFSEDIGEEELIYIKYTDGDKMKNLVFRENSMESGCKLFYSDFCEFIEKCNPSSTIIK